MPILDTTLSETVDRAPHVDPLAALYRYKTREIVDLAVRRDLARMEEQLLGAIADLFTLERMHRDYVAKHAASIEDYDDIPDDLAETWLVEARQLGEYSRFVRSFADEIKGINAEAGRLLPHRERPDEVEVRSEKLAERMTDFADFLEDVAETQALAAHKPFRDGVTKGLAAAGAS